MSWLGTEDHVRASLQAVINRAGSQKKAALHLKISEQYLCDVLKKRRAISDELAQKLGYRRICVFERLP